MSFARYAHLNTTDCIHKLATGCRLYSSRECCACADTRPHAPAYPVFDGQAVKYHTHRWEGYCFKCKDYWNTISRLHPLPPLQPVLPQYPSFDATHPRFPHFPTTHPRPFFNPAETCPARTALSQHSQDNSPERVRDNRFNTLPIPFALPIPIDQTSPHELASGQYFGPPSMASPPGSPELMPRRPVLHLPGSSHFGRPESPPSELGGAVAGRPLMSQRARQNSSDTGLRSHYRAFLDSERTTPESPHHPGSLFTNTAGNLSRGNYRRQNENPIAAQIMREDGERMEIFGLPSDVRGQPPSWDPRPSANPPLHLPGGPSISTGVENQPPSQPNPLMNPPIASQRPTPSFYPSYRSQPEFARGRLGGSEYHGHGRLPDYQQLPGGYGVSYAPPNMPNIYRRHQNGSAPNPPVTYTPAMSSIRRSMDGHRRSGARGESEATGMMRRDYSDEMVGARLNYPYVMQSALARDHYYELHGRDSASETESEPNMTFDTQSRPPPKNPEDMMLDMSCSICKEHTIDTVVLPCGHAVMCSYCAELQVPCRKRDKSTPRDRTAKCPMCRSKIKQRYKIFHS